MSRLSEDTLPTLAMRPGRYADGDGLSLRVMDARRRYWTYRYTLGRGETELSLGPYPKIGLDEARAKRAELHAKAHGREINWRLAPRTALDRSWGSY